MEMILDEKAIQEEVVAFLNKHDQERIGVDLMDLAEQIHIANPIMISGDVFEVILDMGASGMLDIKEGLKLSLPPEINRQFVPNPEDEVWCI